MKEKTKNIHFKLFISYVISTVILFITARLLHFNVMTFDLLVIFGSPILYSFQISFMKKRRVLLTLIWLLAYRIIFFLPIFMSLSFHNGPNIFDILFIMQQYAPYFILPLIMDYIIIIYWGNYAKRMSSLYVYVTSIPIIISGYIGVIFLIYYINYFL